MQGDGHPCDPGKPAKDTGRQDVWFEAKDVTSRQKELMSGRQVEPMRLESNENVADMIDNCYGASGFNGRRLAEACQLYSRMLKKGATVGLTLSGAMTPIGLQGVVISLIRAGYVDWIISTGANLFHDTHRAFDYPVTQGHWSVDDNELADASVARIYDTFIADADTLMATDRLIMGAVDAMERSGPISTAEFHWQLGRVLGQQASHPEKSMLMTAHECDVPIYTSSPGDSAIAMSLIVSQMFGKPIQIDPLRDVIETTALVRAADLNGVVQVGGGSPKNFYMQTQPTLHQVLHDEKGGGHDYFIQLTADAPHWGGLSGATPSEAKSWGKLKDAMRDNVVVYSCASLTFPLLAQYVLSRNEPRPLRRLFQSINSSVEAMRSRAERNPELRRDLEALGLSANE
jgi:deoxyhypusine synthase